MKVRVLLVLLGLLLCACSRRVEYSVSSNVAVSPDAININTASANELEQLPHIGKKTADAIVEFRTQNGPFQRPEQVMLIRSISEKRFLEMRPLLKAE